MTKKAPVNLDDLVQMDPPSAQDGIPQRGAPTATRRSAPQPRNEGKRLTLALDTKTYRRLRMYAAQHDFTHQTILETALMEFLERANA